MGEERSREVFTHLYNLEKRNNPDCKELKMVFRAFDVPVDEDKSESHSENPLY